MYVHFSATQGIQFLNSWSILIELFKKSHIVSSPPCNGPRAPSPRSTPVYTNYSTQQRELKSRSSFVPDALVLLKDLDKSNITAAFWTDHKWNTK